MACGIPLYASVALEYPTCPPTTAGDDGRGFPAAGEPGDWRIGDPLDDDEIGIQMGEPIGVEHLAGIVLA